MSKPARPSTKPKAQLTEATAGGSARKKATSTPKKVALKSRATSKKLHVSKAAGPLTPPKALKGLEAVDLAMRAGIFDSQGRLKPKFR